MKKLMILASAFLLVFGIVGSAAAYTLSYEYAVPVDNSQYTTAYSWATVETFEQDALLWTWTPTGEFTVRSGLPISGESAPPAGDTTYYVSIPDVGDNDNTASVTVTDLGGTYDYFGLFWGSVDSYNALSFYKEGSLQQTITGSMVTTPSDGNQAAPSTNLYVNIWGLDFDSFVMTSTNMAFEADNIAIGSAPVPEPATMLLLGIGLVGLAGASRKKLYNKN